MSKAVATIAAVLCALLASAGCGRSDPTSELDAAVGESRRSLGRSTLLRHRPLAAKTRGQGRDDPKLLSAVAHAGRRARGADGALPYIAGLREAGHVADSIAFGERQASDTATDAPIASELCASYLERGRSDEQPDDLFRALDLCLRASNASPGFLPALFNRALVLAELGLHAAAADTWDEYLRRDAQGPWADEARSRLHRSDTPSMDWADELRMFLLSPSRQSAAALIERFPQAAREQAEWVLPAGWADAYLTGDVDAANRTLGALRPLAAMQRELRDDALALDLVSAIDAASEDTRERLARAARDFNEGKRLYELDRRVDAGVRFLAGARACRDADAPCWGWSDLYLAILDTHTRDLAGASARLEPIRDVARAKNYAGLFARAEWLQGVVHLQASRPAAALDGYRTAIAVYERLEEDGNAASVYNAAADTLRILGGTSAGWGYIRAALRKSPAILWGVRTYTIYFNASLYSLRDGLLDAALFLQNLALQQAYSRGGAGTVTEAYIRRGVIRLRMGDVEACLEDLDRARRALAIVSDASQLRYHSAWIRALEGEALIGTAPALARAQIGSAIGAFRRIEPAEVPRLFLALGRAALASGDRAAANAAVTSGLADMASRRARLTESELRAQYVGEAANLVAAKIELEFEQASPLRALATAEEWRARTLFERMSETRRREPPLSEIPESTAVVYYAVIDDRLLSWVLTPREARAVLHRTGSADVARLVTAYRRAMEGGAGESTLRAAGSRLFEELLLPHAAVFEGHRTIVIVPDGVLHDLPFAALVRSGKYLVEAHQVVVAPSLRTFFDASRRLGHLQVSAPESVLAVGNPTITATFFRHLRDLPESAREAREIALLYPSASVLVGAEASKTAFVGDVAAREVVHFGGHAVVNPDYPSMSYLVFSSGAGADDPMLYAYEIERLPLGRTRTVVLSACQTGRGVLVPGEGVLSLARPFLAAGAASVIATLWDVEDRASGVLSTYLHQELIRSADTATALQRAQLRMLNDPLWRHPRYWAGFASIGGAAPIG